MYVLPDTHMKKINVECMLNEGRTILRLVNVQLYIEIENKLVHEKGRKFISSRAVAI